MIVWALGFILAIFAEAEIIRTQMDVDYAGRVRQAPGANSVHIQREQHDVRDEEEDEPLQNHDEDEAGDDMRVPSIAESAQQTMMNQVSQEMKILKKKPDTSVSSLRDEVIRSASAIPFSNIWEAQDSPVHKTDEVLEEAIKSAADGIGLSKGADLALAVEKKVEDTLKDGAHALKAAEPGFKVAQNHLPKLMKDIQDDIAAGHSSKVMADVQDHLQEASLDFVKGQMENLDPATVVKAVADVAKLAQDAKSTQGPSDTGKVLTDVKEHGDLDPAEEVQKKILQDIGKALLQGTSAQNTVGAREGVAQADTAKVSDDHQGGSEPDLTSNLINQALKDLIKNLGMDHQTKNMDPATAVEIAAGIAKLAKDVQKAGGQKKEALNAAQMHLEKRIKNIQDATAEGNAGKALAFVQGQLKEASGSPKGSLMDAVKDLMDCLDVNAVKQFMEKMMNIDPANAVKVAADSAKLAQDVRKAVEHGQDALNVKKRI